MTPTFKRGMVVGALLPQADGQRKRRPAIVLCEVPPFQDVLVCGVSTQLERYVEELDEIIAPGDVDFAASGLISKSLIRSAFLATLSRKQILGISGAISAERYKRLLRKLNEYLIKDL